MIVIVSDTHSTDGHELTGETLTAVRAADLVIHAGDFKSAKALDAFESVASELVAVAGNVDEPAVSERLPIETIIDTHGIRIAVTHTVDGGEQGLATFGRSHDADLVVFGHSHRPTLIETDELVMCNPGSHAQSRGNRPGFAILEGESAVSVEETTATEEPTDTEETTLTGRLLEPDGTEIASFEVSSS